MKKLRGSVALLVGAVATASVFASCKPAPSRPTDADEVLAPSSSEPAPPPESTAIAPKVLETKAIALREGQALVRGVGEAALYVADEDHAVLRRVPLVRDLAEPPVATDPPTVMWPDVDAFALPLPGRPAQALALDGIVLVTVRDPGMLVVVRAGERPTIEAKIELPGDAWGLAVSPDLATAYVTSAWSHALSAVDLATRKVKWTIDLAREPRGVAASVDGEHVYVTHLVGAPLSVVDVAGDPRVDRLPFPADPLRTKVSETTSASLGYAALLSPDGRRLFVGRQALGSAGAWQGAPTIDVLATKTNTPIAPVRKGPPLGTITKDELAENSWGADAAGLRMNNPGAWIAPRAMVYRKKTDHLLVASEGQPMLAELDALSISPGLVTNRVYLLGGFAPSDPTAIQIAPDCGAPTGVALSEDEDVAWVYCRSTDNIVAVRLTPNGVRGVHGEIEFVSNGRWNERVPLWGPFATARLVAEEARPNAETKALALGRRLFYDASEPAVSGGMSCAGCHPEGRDDGHVWREVKKYETDESPTFVSGPSILPLDDEQKRTDGVRYGVARQTPMLAGRVDAAGPYGWHAESADIVSRIKSGFSLHRWWDRPANGPTNRMRAEPLALFVRKGLVPPPHPTRELNAEEEHGKAIFESPKARCATCHVPATGFTDRSTVVVPLVTPALFDEEENKLFKVPSLLYVGGTAPYYHDGSFATLEDLVEKNRDRMGKTSHLSAAEKKALVAYLRTL